MWQYHPAASGYPLASDCQVLSYTYTWQTRVLIMLARLGTSCDLVQVCTKRLITAEKLINGLGRDLSKTTPMAMTTDQAMTSKRSRHKRYKR